MPKLVSRQNASKKFWSCLRIQNSCRAQTCPLLEVISFPRRENDPGCARCAFLPCLRVELMPATVETSEAAILGRVIRPSDGTWSREAAESILKFDFA